MVTYGRTRYRQPPELLVGNEKWEARNSDLPLIGVDDGTRTRDSQDHNLVLYQLNYIHHRHPTPGLSRLVSEPRTL